MKKKYLVVGAGFSGSVLANELAENINCSIDVWDERLHIGGNCYTERDSNTGIMEHKYGPHIFNTDKKEIWDYINRFTEMQPFVNRVKADFNGNIYSLPVNLHTINQLFDKSFSPEEAKEFILSQANSTIGDPQNFEEQALKYIGEDLYRAFFYGYTKKQWGCEPSTLPASILKRLPVRFNYNDNYYNNVYQGIPKNGYTEIFEKLLNKPNITVSLNKKFNPETPVTEYDHIFYTGPIDAYFNYIHGRLSYRTVEFQKYQAEGDYQGNAVINYCDEHVKYTRIHEHKHFTPWEQHDKTIYFKEFSKETVLNDIPYYPKRLSADMELLNIYVETAKKMHNVSFLGRLATYRYMDMHHVIAEALKFSNSVKIALLSNTAIPVFPELNNL